MNNAVLAAIFDTYNTGDYPEEIRSSIDAMADVKLVEEKGFYYMGEQIHG